MGEYADYEIEKEMFGCNDFEENYLDYTYSKRKRKYKYIPYFYAKKHHENIGIEKDFESVLNDFIIKYNDKIQIEFEGDLLLLEKSVRKYGSAWYCRFNDYLRNVKRQQKRKHQK